MIHQEEEDKKKKKKKKKEKEEKEEKKKEGERTNATPMAYSTVFSISVSRVPWSELVLYLHKPHSISNFS